MVAAGCPSISQGPELAMYTPRTSVATQLSSEARPMPQEWSPPIASRR